MNSRYSPPQQLKPEKKFNERYYNAIKSISLDQLNKADHVNSFAIIGFCCDEGVRRNNGRPGAAKGPQAFREVFWKLPIPDAEQFSIVDAGDIICNDGDLESSQTALGDAIFKLLDYNYCPIVIGGGHELAWGHYQGIAQSKYSQDLGIINFDAHFDIRPLVDNCIGSSGTPFKQIFNARTAAGLKTDYTCIGIQRHGNCTSLFEEAKKLNISFVEAESLFQTFATSAEAVIHQQISSHQYLYLSICLDVFEASAAPGVSAPQVLGLNPWQVIPLIRTIAKSGKLCCFDIAELSPLFDRDDITAKLAAILISEVISNRLLTP